MAKSYSGVGPSAGSQPEYMAEPPSETPSHGAFDAMNNGLPMPESVEYE